MKTAIMQPYFAPYIGYFQLMNCVDNFVVYDNIQFTKKGWINRNRLLMNGKDESFSIPISKDSDFLDINQRRLSADYLEANKKTLRKIESSYRNAPFYNSVINELNKCFLFENHDNLFDFILNSILIIKEYLKIETNLLISSQIDAENHNYRAQERVKYICEKIEANHYINPIGGLILYDKVDFSINNIQLNFLKSRPSTYRQFTNEFVPWLSIIDIMMFNSIEEIQIILDNYELI